MIEQNKVFFFQAFVWSIVINGTLLITLKISYSVIILICYFAYGYD